VPICRRARPLVVAELAGHTDLAASAT